MKIVTQDYGCGTSSSILDYNIEDVVLVSPSNYEHVFEVDDDLFFVGHDFLFFLWDNMEKVERWKSHRHRKVVWCFERIDAIVPQWKAKGEYSLEMLKHFVDQIYVCDEDDALVYGDWLPQWASRKFYDMKDIQPSIHNKYLFSGQAGKPEYGIRTQFLNAIFLDEDLKGRFQVTNFSRNLSWNDYCRNLLNYDGIFNPVGILRGFNTRAYEVMYSGRKLLQQTFGNYVRHEKLLDGHDNVILFQSLEEMKSKVLASENHKSDPDKFFMDNSIYARFRNIGVEIK